MKRQIVLVSRMQEAIQIDKDENKGFYNQFQRSVLLALLDQRKLTKWQFDRCIELLEKQL